MAGDNFIRSYRERMAKKQDNETEILRFLKDEIFSTAEILSKLLNYTAASTAYSTLNRMCANGLLSTDQVNLGGTGRLNCTGSLSTVLSWSWTTTTTPLSSELSSRQR